jgi:D-alanyl-D-alanine carboxypeptidase
MRAWWRCFLTILSIFALQAGVVTPATAKGKSAGNSKYAAIVVAADSGDVLFERNPDAPRYPASLTKMMTLYLLFEELNAGRLALESDLTVSAQAAAQPPSKLGLGAGSTIDVETAIKALTVKSANDAAVVIAESISGSEWRFAQKMTEKARTLGMTRTTFRNASGLPNIKQKTTARDLATLGRRLAQDFPQYYGYFSAPSLAWNGRTYLTHNALVQNFPGAEGLKTGYTRVSGFNLATSARRDGTRLIGVVMGGRSVRTRDDHMRSLLNDAFAALKGNPNLIASLHRETPTPRIKPTLLAQLERDRAVPTVGGSDAVRGELIATASTFSQANAEIAYDDAIALLAAAATSDENAGQPTLALNDADEELVGEGDLEAAGGWSVQIGAYSTEALANKELDKAEQIAGLSDRARTIQPSAGAPLYRARFTSLSASEADMICAMLKAKRKACFVISDSDPNSAP